jgi:hypothetical protein
MHIATKGDHCQGAACSSLRMTCLSEACAQGFALHSTHPGSTKLRHRSSIGTPSTVSGPACEPRPPPPPPPPLNPDAAASFSRVAPSPASTRRTSNRSTARPSAILQQGRVWDLGFRVQQVRRDEFFVAAAYRLPAGRGPFDA